MPLNINICADLIVIIGLETYYSGNNVRVDDTIQSESSPIIKLIDWNPSSGYTV